MFLHENKKEWIAYQQSRQSARSHSPRGSDGKGSKGRPRKSSSLKKDNLFTFKPQITDKSRNLAENYKKTFAERLSSLLADNPDENFVPINYFSTTEGGLK